MCILTISYNSKAYKYDYRNDVYETNKYFNGDGVLILSVSLKFFFQDLWAIYTQRKSH